MHSKSVRVKAIFYDNACKLFALVRSKKDMCPPMTDMLAKIKILLDQVHRDNHVWCLENLPEVDCKSAANEEFVDGVNTQACEEMNSFINDHTVASLEMTKGRYYIYWYALFRMKNARTLAERRLARQRFARGFAKQDPDKVMQTKRN